MCVLPTSERNMWSQAVFMSLLAAFALTNGSLLDALTAVHANPAFHTLQPAEQVLIIELIAEVEAGELKSYIDQVGFHHVLAIIDSKYDIIIVIITNPRDSNPISGFPLLLLILSLHHA